MKNKKTSQNDLSKTLSRDDIYKTIDIILRSLGIIVAFLALL